MRPRTLEQAIGGELKRLRESRGVPQGAVANAAYLFGLNWTQSTVAAIEGGRRSLTIGELGHLPTILQVVGIPNVGRVVDLIPDTDERILIWPGHEAPLKSVRWFYGTVEEREAAPGYEAKPPGMVITEAERKAARALKTTPARVSQAAQELWHHSLDEERDRLTGDLAATPQKRGRVTRLLMRDLKRKIRRRG
jgi:transcriptional regulator with XRE-family HTH domain